MWREDVGALPVVDPEGRLVGVVTDRDVCMAAYTTGRALPDLRAADAMSRTVHACEENDTSETVHRLMRKLQVRRVPVVNDEGKLIGLVGLGDLARAALESAEESEEFTETFTAVSRPRKLAERIVPSAPAPALVGHAKGTTRRSSRVPA
jgi:CBS-domain-containing membrane protein